MFTGQFKNSCFRVEQDTSSFWTKIWMAIDAESKTLFPYGFPYLGKGKSRDLFLRVPSNVVTKLIQPFFIYGYNVICHNFYIFL